MSLRERVINLGRTHAFSGKSSLRGAIEELRLRLVHPFEKQRTPKIPKSDSKIVKFPQKPEITWQDLPESITKRIPPQGY